MIKFIKCKRCRELFLPQTIRTKYCSNCAGKDYPLRKKTISPELLKLYRSTQKYKDYHFAYESQSLRKLKKRIANRHLYHKIVDKKFSDCPACL